LTALDASAAQGFVLGDVAELVFGDVLVGRVVLVFLIAQIERALE
jgi:hypothetical protein